MPRHRFPLVQPIESRTESLSTDSVNSNCLIETQRGKHVFKKRPGLANAVLVTALPNGLSHGLFRGSLRLWADAGGTLYSYDTGGNRTSYGALSGNGQYLDTFCELGTSGNTTLTYPTPGIYTLIVAAGVTSIQVTAAAGGAGGGAGNRGISSGGGGGSSPVITTTLAVTPGHQLSIAVGAAGSGGAIHGGNGTNGGTTSIIDATSITTLLSITGPTGGLGSGAGGGAGTSLINGVAGPSGQVGASASGRLGGNGGSNSLATGGLHGTASSGGGLAVAVAGGTPGAGGGGGGATLAGDPFPNDGNGANGGPGYVSITTVVDTTSLLVNTGTSLAFVASGSGALSTAFNATPPYAAPVGPYAYGLVNLDGYAIFMTANGTIQTSALNDPSKWDATHTILFSGDSGSGVAIGKQLNYLVAHGQWSTQFFYDAGLGTGSPLALNQSATFNIGCASGPSVQFNEMTYLWVGQSKTTGRAVYMLDGLTPVRISTRWVEKYLDSSQLADVRSSMIKYQGHTLYFLSIHDWQATGITFVYDIEEKIWTTWSTTLAGVENYFRPAFAATLGNQIYMLDDDTSALYILSETAYSDTGNVITVRCVTENMDFGTTAKKRFLALELIGDKVNSTIAVSHSSNDYQSWSAARTVSLNSNRSEIMTLGYARRRAFRFVHTDTTTPLRIFEVELEFEMVDDA